MDASTVLIGATLVVVGFLAYQALQPPAKPPPSASSGAAGLLDTLLTNKSVKDFGASLLSKASVALGGSSSW
jgi:hypothetical protein